MALEVSSKSQIAQPVATSKSNDPLPFAQLIDAPFEEAGRLRSGLNNALLIYWKDGFPVAQRWYADGKAGPLLGPGETPPNRTFKDEKVSLVICTRDRPRELRRCLQSLKQQSVQPTEVIVVDNASITDETKEVAHEAGVIYIREDRPGLDIARNTGALASRYAFVAYTDDDTELHKEWLRELLAGFTDDSVMAVTGLVLPASLETEAQWIFEREWSFGRGFLPLRFDSTRFTRFRKAGYPAWEIGAGANMAFRRSIFDKIGFFDERLDVGASGCSGDSEFWYRILAAGWDCLYQPSAVVRHYHREHMDGLRRQIFSYMRGHTSALLVQYERTNERGNLKRLLVSLPLFYLRKLVRKCLKSDYSNIMLFEEMRGALSGVAYYLQRRTA